VAHGRDLDAGRRLIVTVAAGPASLLAAVATQRVTVLVVSTHPVIEGVLRLAAEATPGIDDVVSLSRPEALEGTIVDSMPAIAVIDLDPLASVGLEAVRRARDASSRTRIIVLSERDDGALVLEAMRLGVHAFLRKPEAIRDIGSALIRVLAGERVVAPELEQTAVLELGRFARQVREGSEVGGSLTPREREILELLAEGFTMRQMGRTLGISPRTVETHVAKLYRKLSVRTRVQAVSRAAALGLLELE
jgi:DNA-binding NarL/FixJ family response regulator